MISNDDQQKALQSALYYLCSSQPFYGSLLQELTLRYTSHVPTAGITFDKTQTQFEVLLNPEFFCTLDLDQRVAVLHHEILHFTNQHLFRLPFLTSSEEERSLYNIAGDMSINQYIPNLPAGVVDVKDWFEESPGKTKKDPPVKTPFPTLQSMETYYELLKNNKDANKKNFKEHKPFDVHDWEALDSETKSKMLEETKKILNRTIEKTSYSHSTVPNSIKDLLEEIEVLGSAINYKQILKQVIKRNVSATDRTSTWNRPNKRYGVAAPGTKIGMLPKLSMYCDTSGSISHTELNEFLNIVDGFLGTGVRECTLVLWHTGIYYKKKYRISQTLTKQEIESGGTAIDCVLGDIKKHSPNLSIILTDGHYDSSTITPTSEILWIISRGGNMNHPLKKLGKTITLEGLKQ